MLLFNIYDDWLKSVSSFTAFSRLILILRGIKIDVDRAKMILRPDLESVTEPHHVWPTLSDEEWISAEVALKDMILEDYGSKNNVSTAALTDSEIRDIILGMEIAAPSQQRQEMAEIEKSARDQAQKIATTVKTVNTAGEELVVTTETAYEQETFSSKTDWRSRAISVANLHLRTQNIYVASDEIRDDGFTYVMPKNILKKFVCIADLRTQVFGYMYGLTPAGGDTTVKEIRCIVLVPQIGTHKNITIPKMFPVHDSLDELEPLGWIHTQPQEMQHLSPEDAMKHAKLTVASAGAWDGDREIIMTCAFTPGSCSLSAYRLNEAGHEWSLQNDSKSPNPPGYNSSLFDKSQLLLSDRFQGFFLTPLVGGWNYNFRGVELSVSMQFDVVRGIPEAFYDELHRPNHFLQFAHSEIEDLKDDDFDEYYESHV